MAETSPTPILQPLKIQARRFHRLWSVELWRRELPSPYTAMGLYYRLLRFLHLMLKGFREDDIQLHAKSLTYSTLIALVPLIALSLSVLKGLGYDNELNQFLTDFTKDTPPQLQKMVQQIMDAVNNANFAKIGSVGGVVVLWMVIQVLSRIESSFNTVWGIQTHRTWLRKITDYISIVVIVPVLFVTAITLSAENKFGGQLLEQLGLLRMAPFFATWIAFVFLYKAMPNTTVKTWSVVLGGFIGALLWQGWFKLYITLQPGVTNYNVIYGTLASIPIFLIWLNVNWAIILLGAKVTFAIQNGGNYQPEKTYRNASPKARAWLALAVLARMGDALIHSGKKFHADAFASEHHVPQPLLEDTLRWLGELDLIAETASDQGIFVLTRHPQKISLLHVLKNVFERGQSGRQMGFSDQELEPTPTLESFLAQFDNQNLTVEDLISRFRKQSDSLTEDKQNNTETA